MRGILKLEQRECCTNASPAAVIKDVLKHRKAA